MSQVLENWTVRIDDAQLEELERNLAELYLNDELENISKAEAVRRLIEDFNDQPNPERLQ